MGAEAGGGGEGRDNDRDGRREWARQLTTYGTVGMMFPVSIAFGFLGGWVLDRWLGTDPWLQLAGFALGVAAAIRHLLGAFAQMSREDPPDEPPAANRGTP